MLNNELVSLANKAVPLLAAGLVDQVRLIKEEKRPFVHDDDFLSGNLKMAMLRLASLYLLSGRENTVCGAHNLVERCKKPFSEKHWGLPVFDMPGFHYKALALLFDDDLSPDGLPLKNECVDIASGLTTYADYVEKEIFRELLEICEKFGCEDDRHKVYSALREFVVRHPVTTREEYGRFMDRKAPWAKGLAESILSTCYIPTQPHHLVNGMLLKCGNCGAPMKSYQNTDRVCCQIEECKNFRKPIQSSSALTITKESLVAKGAVLRYWVGPGIDEVALYDAAIKAGFDALLYPYMDRCDVCLNDTIGIDIKSYTNPKVLADQLRRKKLGGLVAYKTRYIAINDNAASRYDDYLAILRNEWRNETSSVRFVLVSDLCKKIKKGAVGEDE